MKPEVREALTKALDAIHFYDERHPEVSCYEDAREDAARAFVADLSRDGFVIIPRRDLLDRLARESEELGLHE